MRVDKFDYTLPKELIAQEPLPERDSSRLMVLRGGEIVHRSFRDIVGCLDRGDLLVVNNSKVIPAKLRGRKSTGGRVELLLLSHKEMGWECLVRGRVKRGAKLSFAGNLEAEVLEKKGEKALLKFSANGSLKGFVDKVGMPPTPPYIKKKVGRNDYQTVYAKREGSVAAPTAGFHFTERLLEELRAKHVEIAEVTLHVGMGTFQPVKVERVEHHRMHSEECFIEPKEAEKINLALEEGRGVVAVGTTSLRVMESAADRGRVLPGSFSTNLFIYPGYEFRLDYRGLVTNFHLPRSTLLMLVSAFTGREKILRAYSEAIRLGYRFFSFGDAMLILK